MIYEFFDVDFYDKTFGRILSSKCGGDSNLCATQVCKSHAKLCQQHFFGQRFQGMWLSSVDNNRISFYSYCVIVLGLLKDVFIKFKSILTW